MTVYRTARVYLQIADRTPRNSWGEPSNATIVTATNTMPTVIAEGCIIVPLTIRIPLTRWPKHDKGYIIELPETEDVEATG